MKVNVAYCLSSNDVDKGGALQLLGAYAETN